MTGCEALLANRIREALQGMGGHSHWREGGIGGFCSTCERDAELRAAGLAALDALVADCDELMAGHWSRTSGPEWRENESGYGNF